MGAHGAPVAGPGLWPRVACCRRRIGSAEPHSRAEPAGARHQGHRGEAGQAPGADGVNLPGALAPPRNRASRQPSMTHGRPCMRRPSFCRVSATLSSTSGSAVVWGAPRTDAASPPQVPCCSCARARHPTPHPTHCTPHSALRTPHASAVRSERLRPVRGPAQGHVPGRPIPQVLRLDVQRLVAAGARHGGRAARRHLQIGQGRPRAARELHAALRRPLPRARQGRRRPRHHRGPQADPRAPEPRHPAR